MRWLALEHSAATNRADEFTIAYRHFATNGRHTRPPFDLPSFKCAIIHIHRLRFGKNRSAIFRIANN